MRIVGGRHRGRRLAPPPRKGVRPTPDPVREALFNILGARVIDQPFIDLAAGTGAVGLEALSRGARPVWLVERDLAALRVIRRNLQLLGLDSEPGQDVFVVQADVGAWLAGPARSEVPPGVGVVFMDPPYGMPNLDRWSSHLVAAGILDNESLVVVEHRSGETPELPGLLVRWTRRYGDTSLTAAALPDGFEGVPERAGQA